LEKGGIFKGDRRVQLFRRNHLIKSRQGKYNFSRAIRAKEVIKKPRHAL